MSFKQVIARYKWNFLFMLFLVLLDAGLLILFPLFIGYAIDDVLTEQYQGAILLGVLGLATLAVGACRRFYDSRFYARIYQHLGAEVGGQSDQPTSTKTAHLGFLGEVVEFMENSMPEIINNSIGLIGTLIIISTMDLKVFFGCLMILLIVAIVYGFSEKRTVHFNSSYNNELEKQVSVVSANQPILLRGHLRKLMKWNVRLSDLETINFSVIWLFMMAFLVLSIVSSVSDGPVSYGAILSLVLYLFQFIESVTTMPLYYQQWLRLTEITNRLGSIGTSK